MCVITNLQMWDVSQPNTYVAHFEWCNNLKVLNPWVLMAETEGRASVKSWLLASFPVQAWEWGYWFVELYSAEALGESL